MKRNILFKSAVALVFSVLAHAAHAQVGSLPGSLGAFSTFFKSNLYYDTYTGTTSSARHKYYFEKVANPANGRTRGPLNPWFTGVTQFDIGGGLGDTKAFVFTSGTLAPGGLTVTKTGNFTLVPSTATPFYFHVTSGTNAVVGDYLIDSTTANTLVLHTSAGSGGGASDLAGYIHCPQNDPSIQWGYNIGGPTSAQLSVAGEFSASWVLETDYYRPDAFLRRDSEFYMRFCKKDGSGNEIRPIAFTYSVDNHQITGSDLLTSGALYGEVLTISQGDTRSPLFQFGNGSFNMRSTNNGDMGFNIHAQPGYNSYVRCETGNDAGYFGLGTLSDTVGSFTISGVEGGRVYKTNDSHAAWAINNTSNSAGLTVQSPTGGNGYSLVVRPSNDLTGDMVRFETNGGTALMSWDVNGVQSRQKISVASVASAGSTIADAATLTAGVAYFKVTASGSGKGIILTAPVIPGEVVEGFDTSTAFAINVYPPNDSTSVLNSGSAGAAVSVPAKKPFRVVWYDTTHASVLVGS